MNLSKLSLLSAFVYLVAVLSLNPVTLPVDAAVSSCTATVSPNSVTNNSSGGFTFSVENTDSVNFKWIKITRPSSNFTIVGGGVGGWSMATESDAITLTGGTLTPPGTQSVSATVEARGGETASADWSIQASDDTGGASPFSCTGTLGTAIEGAGADTFAPVISGITIHEIGDTEAKVSWTTDEAASSTVHYGTTSGYGESTINGDMVTSRTLHVTGLSANTTYHYQIQTTDAAGNAATTADNTFVTSSEQTTIIVTDTVTETQTVTETKTVIKVVTKLIKDTSSPSVALTTDFSAFFSSAPRITGSATDNVGISKIEYSIDGARNWLPADNISALNAKSTTFDFTPVGLLDGNYEVMVRVTDPSGNIRHSEVETLVFDRLPPGVGAALYSLGPQILNPNSQGLIVTQEGLEQTVTLSAVGGPTEIDISSTPIKGKSLGVQNSRVKASEVQMFSLVKNPETGLWSGTLSFSREGTYKLTARAVDGVENKRSRDLNQVLVLPAGKITGCLGPCDQATATLYYFEPTTERFIVWDGRPFGQKNPQKTDKDGKYNLIAPAGKYYLSISAPGYKTLTTNIFRLGQSLPLNTDFKLTATKTLKLGGFALTLPTVGSSSVEMEVVYPTIPEDLKPESSLAGSSLPFFVLESEGKLIYSTSLRGKPTVLTLLSSWAPQSSEQVPILEELSKNSGVSVNVMINQETSSRVEIFKKRGGYTLPILADSSGGLVEALKLKNVPTHIFIDRSGIVKKVEVGVLNKQELLDNLLE